MKQKEICKEEINLFYLWLCGTIGKEKGEDKRLVYLCCPAERDTLLRLFLEEYNAQHRYSAFKRRSSLPHALLQQKECSHYKPMYANTWNDYTQITPTQKELLP